MAVSEAPPLLAAPAPAVADGQAGRGPAGADGAPTGTPVLVAAYVLALICIPSVWVLGPLGAVGSPAGILSCLMLAVWALGRLIGPSPGRSTPVHRLLVVFAAAFALAVVAAALRPMAGVEHSAALRGIVIVSGWLGVALLVAEGLRSRAQLYSLVRLTVGLATLLAVLGFAQFVTGLDIVNNLRIPGLTLNSTAVTLYERAGFARVNATTMHAIEFATVLAMALPLAVAEALRRRTPVAVGQAVLIAGALPLTVSRSGMLGLAIGLVFTFVVVGRRLRLVLLALLPLGAAAFVAVTPGLLGTIRDLFLAGESDTSISARTDDYPAVQWFFEQAPWLGRGPFTFLPSTYRTLDNQYLGTLVEGGAVGLVALVALVAVPVVLALRAARRLPDAADRALCGALAAAFGVAMVLFLTFDAFSFPTAMGIFFLLLGLLGAVTRLLPQADEPSYPGAAPDRRVRRLAGAAAVLAALVVLGSGAAVVVGAQPHHDARGTTVLAVPGQSGQNIYSGKLETEGVADLVVRLVESEQSRQRLAAAGHGPFTLAIGYGSLAPYTEIRGSGDVISISAVDADPARAAATALAVRDAIEDALRDLQAGRGIDPGVQVAVVESFTAPAVTVLAVHPLLGLVGLAVLGGMAAVGARALVLRRR